MGPAFISTYEYRAFRGSVTPSHLIGWWEKPMISEEPLIPAEDEAETKLSAALNVFKLEEEIWD